MDKSRSIRGGIPVCFPQFGQRIDLVSPQHGWARLNTWDHPAPGIMSIRSTDPGVVNGRPEGGHWPVEGCPHDVGVEVRVELDELGGLVYTCQVENLGSCNVPFQLLLHNYFRFSIPDGTVKGLEGYRYIDTQPPSASGWEFSTQGDGPVKITREHDVIYHPPSGVTDLKAEIKSEACNVRLNVNARIVGGEDIPVSAVVWNPGPEKAKRMSDFDDDGYKGMVCVEPGIIEGQRTMKGGEKVEVVMRVSAF